MKLLSVLGACALSAAVLSTTDANSANLIVNGGFESGDFTGWATDEVSYPMYIVTSPVHDGAYAAQIAGYSYGPDTLTQTVSTTAGVGYSLSFWIYQQAAGPLTFLDVTWDGATIFSKTWSDTGDIPYQNFLVSVVGTGSDILQFSSANDPGWTYIDDISVSAPEPSTWALMTLGFAGLGFAGYRRAKRARTALAAA